MKITLFNLLCLFSITVSAQLSDIDSEIESEIKEFVRKETKYIKALQFKKYYRNFSKDDFVLLFEGEKLDREKMIDRTRKYLKKRRDPEKRDEKWELILTTPFKKFYNDFDLHILTKNDLSNEEKKAPITKAIRIDIVAAWNPKIEFTEDRYLVCLLPKRDASTKSTPKYGEFLILQILEKKGKKWQVYSSYQ